MQGGTTAAPGEMALLSLRVMQPRLGDPASLLASCGRASRGAGILSLILA